MIGFGLGEYGPNWLLFDYILLRGRPAKSDTGETGPEEVNGTARLAMVLLHHFW